MLIALLIFYRFVSRGFFSSQRSNGTRTSFACLILNVYIHIYLNYLYIIFLMHILVIMCFFLIHIPLIIWNHLVGVISLGIVKTSKPTPHSTCPTLILISSKFFLHRRRNGTPIIELRLTSLSSLISKKKKKKKKIYYYFICHNRSIPQNASYRSLPPCSFST